MISQAYIHANNEEQLNSALNGLAGTFTIAEETPEPLPLVYGVIPPFPS